MIFGPDDRPVSNEVAPKPEGGACLSGDMFNMAVHYSNDASFEPTLYCRELNGTVRCATKDEIRFYNEHQRWPWESEPTATAPKWARFEISEDLGE